MFLISLAFFTLFPAGCARNSSPGAPAVAGSYEICDMDCIRIDIRKDGTFSYLVQGDIINAAGPVRGRWEALELPGLIRASSLQQPDRFPAKRVRNPERSYILVRTRDLSLGNVLPGIALELRCQDISGEHDCVSLPARKITDDEGCATFERCASCREMVLFARLSGNAEAFWAIDPGAENELTLEIDPEVSIFISNELWLVYGGNLYFVNKRFLEGVRK